MPTEGQSHCTGNIIYFYRNGEWIAEQSGNCPGTFPFPKDKVEKKITVEVIKQAELTEWDEAFGIWELLFKGVPRSEFGTLAKSLNNKIDKLLDGGLKNNKHQFIKWDSVGGRYYIDFTNITVKEQLSTPAPEEDLITRNSLDFFNDALAQIGAGNFSEGVDLLIQGISAPFPEGEQAKEANEKVFQFALLAIPAGRLGKLSGIAKVKAFFSSKAAKVTGAVATAVGAAKAAAGARGIKTALGVATTLAGIDVLAVWAASDNIITGLSFTAKKIREGVKKGVISGERALEEFKTLETWLNNAVSFVDKSVNLNPTLILFKAPFLINNDKGKADMRLEKLLLITEIKEFKLKEVNKKIKALKGG